MTEKELEILAEKVADLVLKRFVDYYDNHETLEIYKPTEDDVIAFEINRLNKLMSRYEELEEYEKAAIIKRKIEILNKKLNK